MSTRDRDWLSDVVARARPDIAEDMAHDEDRKRAIWGQFKPEKGSKAWTEALIETLRRA